MGTLDVIEGVAGVIRFGIAGCLLVTAMLATLLVTACDPGTEITIQLHNKTDRTIQVTIPEMYAMTKGPPQEGRGVDVTIAPGKIGEVRVALGLGSYAEVVRAYADGNLIFCDRYLFGSQRHQTGTYSVEIVEGHISPGCKGVGDAG